MQPRLNQITLGGRIGKDGVQLRYTPNGKAIASFSMAVRKRVRKDDSGTVIEQDPDWFSIECYGKNAENANEYLVKGQGVTVIGEAHPGHFEGRDGHRVNQFPISAFQLIYGDKPRSVQAAAQEEAEAEKKDTPVEDLPF